MRGVWLLYAAGALLRLWLLNSDTLSSIIASRVELSTPLNSWQRVREGVFLRSEGVAVYSGGVFHETPLTLFFASFLIRSWWWLVQAVFIACDLLTAATLSAVAAAYARKLLAQQRVEEPLYASDSSHLLLRSSSLSRSVADVAAAYLLCPYTILSCAALTTTTFHNLVLALLLLAMIKDRGVIFGILAGVATYQTVYPVVLVVPGLISLYEHHEPSVRCSPEATKHHRLQDTKHSDSENIRHRFRDAKHSDATDTRQNDAATAAAARKLVRGGGGESGVVAIIKSLTAFGVTIVALLFVSKEIAGGWDFLEATYGFILFAPDLTPNIGLFWYFFTEMFEHFRLFFLAVFQLNAVVYVAPLCVRLRGDPLLLSTALLALSSVFRSYPSLGDVGFYLSLLPTARHLYPFLRQSFLVGCMLVASSVLGPIMYNLWIFSGAANANFYFAVTLAFNTAQIFLVTDLLFGHVKRQHLLFNGSSMTIDGQPARLTLE